MISSLNHCLGEKRYMKMKEYEKWPENKNTGGAILRR